MRIVIDVDDVQLSGFNAAQLDFILRVMSQSIRVPSVKDITEVCAKEVAELADGDGDKLMRSV